MKKKQLKLSKEKKKSLITVISISIVLIITLLTLLVLEFIPLNKSSKLMKEFNKYYESEELGVVYYASSTCGYCSLQTPILEKIAETYDMSYLHIDATKLTAEQRVEISKKLDIEGATPSTVVVKAGKVVAKQEGYLDGNDYVEFFKSAGVLGEDAVYEDEQYLTFINYKKYGELISSSSTTVVVLGQTGCGYCTSTKPVLNKIAGKYNITINYLNLSYMTESEYKELLTKLGEYGYDDPDYISKGSIGTPLTLIFKDGKIIDYLAGSTTNSKFVKLFTKNGVIK